MRILIVSDIHAVSDEILQLDNGYSGPSATDFHVEYRTASRNPVLSIAKCLASRDEGRKIDLLVCLGDLAHQAKKLPLLTVWTDLHRLAADLGVANVIGVTGNHDIASRASTIEDIRGRLEYLKEIVPQFPNEDKGYRNSYFSCGVASRLIGDCLVVGVDTCRMHGLGGDEAGKIFGTGHITDEMIDLIDKLVSETAAKHIIVAMHHHPAKVHEVRDEDYDQIENGPRLLQMLADTGKCCFVLHGHKHIAATKRAMVASNAPFILSASSLAAFAYQAHARFHTNQFHILDVDTSILNCPSGTVYSWEWSGTDWQKSARETMPHIVPFGREPNLPDISTALMVLRDENGAMLHEDLARVVPDIRFIGIAQMNELNEMMKGSGRRLVHDKGKILALLFDGGFNE